MKLLLKCLVAALIALTMRPAYAALNILACEPEWAALAKELGGDKVRVSSATTALQDPHRIEARPSLIARARSAQLMVCTGAELEAGWAPLLLAQSGNPDIQGGRPGYFEAAMHVRLIEAPARVDRSAGDVHAAGNPHLHLHPANIATVAVALGERMAQLDASNAIYYRERLKSFQSRWEGATAQWERRAAALKDLPVVVYHRDLSYLVQWLGMREVGALEPKPGVPPSTGHVAELAARLARDPAKAIVRSAYSDPRAAQWLAQRARIPMVTLPYTVGGTDKALDLFGLFDDTIERLLVVAR